MENRREFGKWLQEKRLEAGYSQSQAAKTLKFNTKANVVGYENGMAPVPLERIFDIAKAYSIDIEDILDMIAEYEPNLYRRFKNLENRFFEHFFNKFKGKSRYAHRFQLSPHPGLHKQNYQDTGGHRRKGFLNEKGYLEVDHTIYYQTLIDLIEKEVHYHDGDKGHEGILHRKNQHNGITRPALRYLLSDYPGPGKELHANPVDLDQGPRTTNRTIQGNLGKKPWTALISKYFFKILIIVLLIPGPVKATNPHGLPFSPAEIQQWQSIGERSLYHYREFYYTNPDKSSPWRQAVCVRIKIIFDINERITNIAFLRFGKVYVFDWNVKTGKYEYRECLNPKHRHLWTQGFLKAKAVPKKQ